ncbi:3-dehydroquinate synthase [Oceanobacillus piezotolerans]|uniref:3-dehydroquinate synthase n=1 Tax=Oceanobacillus piezotolerans TaxID=2448030 RepID=A0A498DMD5_9BACI|nr:3-dehydroquinate synthase [Oceanobacillus piezotolerans]RLL48210.1 3-dehydroquinate synthase [Oceanobacillus piezotolerans]
MKEILIQSSSHAYKVIIGERLRFELKNYLKKQYSSILIITDEKVGSLYLSDIRDTLSNENVFETIIPVGEQSKNIEEYYRLHTFALSNGLDRNSLIIALGGGVVGDLAGFVAATFMRGIDYIQVPTTILAHDSSVGGKVAINHELGKNMIGSFYPPTAVFYDVDTLSSLSDQEIRSGYAEIVKEALIQDSAMFHSLMNTNLSEMSSKKLQHYISFGIHVKAQIVENDEKEMGARKYLNLGHTLGHALEANLGYGALTHGEAVAIGLLFALHISEDISKKDLGFHTLYQWMDKNNYPLSIDKWDSEAIIQTMRSDKKTTNHQIQMVLLEDIGNPIVRVMKDEEIRNYLNTFYRKLVTK